MKTLPTCLLQHKRTWKACEKCEIGRHSSRRIFYRGNVPADILIVGEAPGDTEAVLGEPFVGPAGKMLDRIVRKAVGVDIGEVKEGYPTLCATNAIACVPQGDASAAFKLRPPEKDEVINCSPRLKEFIELVHPQVIICAGRIAEQAITHLNPTMPGSYRPIPYTYMPHPAAILRQEERGRLDFKRAIESIHEALNQMT